VALPRDSILSIESKLRPMIFTIHIPKDSARFAQKLRKLFTTNKITTNTYIPENATIGIQAHQNIDSKLLGKVVGLVQRSGHKITIKNKRKIT
jgi:hypothetical protein